MNPALKFAFKKCGIANPEADVLPFSLLSSARLKSLFGAVRLGMQVAGETAEVGCAAGGTSRVIATMNGQRTHWACDTFEGLVDPGKDEPDLWMGQFGSPNVKREIVSKRLSDLLHVNVIEGYFPECAPHEMREARYAFVHIDVDTYASMKSCWEFFAQRMTVGGVIALDDVIGKGTVGGKRFWREVDKSRFVLVSETDPQAVVRFVG